MKVTIYRADDGWRWRCQGNNNENMASGEAYKNMADAQHAVNLLFVEGPAIDIVTDETPPARQVDS